MEGQHRAVSIRRMDDQMETGNLTWAIVATALVLFMTPGVAFFYGGLVKAKSVISMMMMSLYGQPSIY
jgi:ammonia channel protein AmtB